MHIVCMSAALGGGWTLGGDDRAAVREMIAEHGELEAAALLGISRMTLGRALAELPLQLGTLTLIKQRLAQGAR